MEIKYLRKKLTEEELKTRNKQLVNDFNSGMKRLDIAKKYNITLTQIYNIVKSFEN